MIGHPKFLIACHNVMQTVLLLPNICLGAYKAGYETTPVIDQMYYIHDTITINCKHFVWVHAYTNQFTI